MCKVEWTCIEGIDFSLLIIYNHVKHIFLVFLNTCPGVWSVEQIKYPKFGPPHVSWGTLWFIWLELPNAFAKPLNKISLSHLHHQLDAFTYIIDMFTNEERPTQDGGANHDVCHCIFDNCYAFYCTCSFTSTLGLKRRCFCLLDFSKTRKHPQQRQNY